MTTAPISPAPVVAEPAPQPARRRVRGRPRLTEGRDTREVILAAARLQFGDSGYDATTIVGIAAAAHVTPTAVYHHFSNKRALYEAVFDATAPTVWSTATAAMDQAADLVDAITRIVNGWAEIETRLPGLTPFMLSVPREASLHPEFEPLSRRRCELQDEAFRHLAAFGARNGELGGLSEDDAFEFLRSTVMGWVIEGNNRRQQFTQAPRALQNLIRLLSHS